MIYQSDMIKLCPITKLPFELSFQTVLFSLFRRCPSPYPVRVSRCIRASVSISPCVYACVRVCRRYKSIGADLSRFIKDFQVDIAFRRSITHSSPYLVCPCLSPSLFLSLSVSRFIFLSLSLCSHDRPHRLLSWFVRLFVRLLVSLLIRLCGYSLQL